jgi:O-antigen ligase
MFIALAVLGSSKQMWLAFAGAGAMLFLLATIGGRGPLAVALLAIPLMGVGLFLRPQGVFKGLTRLLMFVAILCVIAGATYTVMVQAYGSETWEHLRTLDRYDMQLSSEDTTSLDERRDARELAIQGWQERPILGWGIGEFRVQSVFGYPHNLLLEILMEMGLVGAALFFPICVIAVVACVRVMQRRTSGWAEIAIALLYVTELALHVTVQGYLADNRSFFAYLGLALGMSVGHARTARVKAAPHSSPWCD